MTCTRLKGRLFVRSVRMSSFEVGGERGEVGASPR
jgi:hypothetical protein